MILSTEPPFLFIHIPKTAGTSIEEALFDYQDMHYMGDIHNIVSQYKTYLPDELYDSLFKFTIVRNPWALQVSTYKYYVQANNINMTFKEYVKWKFFENPLKMIDRVIDGNDFQEKKSRLMVAFHMNRMSQIYFLIDESGKIEMDFIGSMENLQEDFNTITNHLKLNDIDLPHANKSSYDDKQTYMDFYDDETKEIITKRFELDIKIFGYNFDLSKPANTGFVNGKYVSSYGLVIPQNFYFNLGSLPYGPQDVIGRYDDSEYQRVKEEFSRTKTYRRIESLNNNLDSIRLGIEEKMKELINSESSKDTLVLQEDILKLREYELVYLTQLSLLQRQIN